MTPTHIVTATAAGSADDDARLMTPPVPASAALSAVCCYVTRCSCFLLSGVYSTNCHAAVLYYIAV
jgi:hypothetical protein